VKHEIEFRLDEVQQQLNEVKHNASLSIVETMDLVNTTIRDTIVRLDAQVAEFNQSYHEKRAVINT
jgi:hypothetical protein